MGGKLMANVTAGDINVDLTVTVNAIIIKKTIPVKETVPFTIAPGFPAGDAKVVVGPFQLPSIPGGISGAVSGQIHISDPSGKPILCVALDLSLLDAEAKELAEFEADLMVQRRLAESAGLAAIAAPDRVGAVTSL